MGRGDRAVRPRGRAADAFGTDRRRPAGVRRACHSGSAGADAAARLAGLPLDARTRPVPAARPDISAVPDRPAGDRGAAVLCHYRRHAGAPVLGPGARCPLRPRGQRPAFLLCQCFVTLSAVVPCRDRPRSAPLVTGLCRSSGNAGKLAMAKGLLRAVGALGPVCLLLDAMRGSLIRTALRLGHEVIGQATPPCSRCRRRASPEGGAGSTARASMPMRLRRCPPRSMPSPAMVADRPGCAMPCAAHASSRASSSG